MKLQLLLANVMNRFMGAIINEDSDAYGNAPQWVRTMLQPIFDILDWLLPVIMILIGVAGVIYIIIVGVKFAKAENADEKDQAKKKLINIAIALIIVLVALILIFIFIKNAHVIFGWTTGANDDAKGTTWS